MGEDKLQAAWRLTRETIARTNRKDGFFCIECGRYLNNLSPKTLFCNRCTKSDDHQKTHDIIYELRRELDKRSRSDVKEESKSSVPVFVSFFSLSNKTTGGVSCNGEREIEMSEIPNVDEQVIIDGKRWKVIKVKEPVKAEVFLIEVE